MLPIIQIYPIKLTLKEEYAIRILIQNFSLKWYHWETNMEIHLVRNLFIPLFEFVYDGLFNLKNIFLIFVF
jgi:hypothetical protein